MAPEPSSDATLSALSLSSGILDPAFASDVEEYTAEVANDVDTITVTATANNANATIEIMPDDANDETAGHQVALAVGDANVITVSVTSEDESATMDYMVTADGEGVAGASATLIQVTGATSGTVLGIGVTGDDGGHTFGPLLAGAYRVDISVDSDEIEFAGGTSWQGQVATGRRLGERKRWHRCQDCCDRQPGKRY